jgi:hypothetical protein
MKKMICLIAIILTIAKLNAAVLLVNNLAGGPGQYTQINDAMAAASPGDTIYVSGSNVTYGTFNITKSIAIIGPGTYSDKQNPFAAMLNGFTCDNNISNIKIKGFLLVDDANFTGTTGVSNLEMVGNVFNQFLTFNGASNFSLINIANNIFPNASLDKIEFVNSSGFSNVTIQNNILFGSIRSLNAPNSIINNNIFINITNAFDAFGAYQFANVMIKDNIFYNSNPIPSTTNCTYQNNISYSTSITYPLMTGSGNLDNVNPLFVNVLSGNYTTAFNFHLQAGSPGIGASSIGDDIGFYGGSFGRSVTGETLNMPVIRVMDVQNQNVPQTGNVNVKVRSTKSRTN